MVVWIGSKRGADALFTAIQDQKLDHFNAVAALEAGADPGTRVQVGMVLYFFSLLFLSLLFEMVLWIDSKRGADALSQRFRNLNLDSTMRCGP